MLEWEEESIEKVQVEEFSKPKIKGLNFLGGGFEIKLQENGGL
jgi:hypothetical protein